jgi:hypothetical protein
MRPPPDPNDPHDIEPRSDVEAVPDEEGVDPATVEDDLALEPEEKRNATDGYAPADDEDAPDTLELAELEEFED